MPVVAVVTVKSLSDAGASGGAVDSGVGSGVGADVAVGADVGSGVAAGSDPPDAAANINSPTTPPQEQ